MTHEHVGNHSLKVFSGRVSVELTRRICDHLSLSVGQARVESFPDTEIIVKLEDDVRGRDCFVVASTSAPVNENLMELLIFIDCLRRASARRVTAVIPYFGYARQDRKDEGRVPITAKLVANLITSARADRVLAIDLHAAQIQGFFDLQVDHLTATPVFMAHFQAQRERLGDLCVLSPDLGNVKVAEMFANRLGGNLAIINKRRISGTEVHMQQVIGTVKGKTVLMFDDMISTAGTICEAAEVCMEQGAREVIAAATHPVLAGRALERLSRSPISQLLVTDTIPLVPAAAALGERISVLSVGDLLGEAIYRIHNNLSISALFQNTAGVKR
jgi:ribose-phosphate pyrophosphokinase